MAGFRITGETIEDIREQLNRVLKKMEEELNIARGYRGDVPMEARMVHTEDIIVNDTTKGLILVDDGRPQTFWRVWVNSSGTLSTESVDPGLKD